MNKVDITISFESDKLDVLSYFLRKKNTMPLRELSKTLDSLYEQSVPKDVREYVESKCSPPSRTKPKLANTVPAAKKEVKDAEAATVLEQST